LIPAEGSRKRRHRSADSAGNRRPSSDKRTGSTSRRFASVRLNLGVLPVASDPRPNAISREYDLQFQVGSDRLWPNRGAAAPARRSGRYHLGYLLREFPTWPIFPTLRPVQTQKPLTHRGLRDPLIKGRTPAVNLEKTLVTLLLAAASYTIDS
jgi:hypothetical protein